LLAERHTLIRLAGFTTELVGSFLGFHGHDTRIKIDRPFFLLNSFRLPTYVCTTGLCPLAAIVVRALLSRRDLGFSSNYFQIFSSTMGLRDRSAVQKLEHRCAVYFNCDATCFHFWRWVTAITPRLDPRCTDTSVLRWMRWL